MTVAGTLFGQHGHESSEGERQNVKQDHNNIGRSWRKGEPAVESEILDIYRYYRGDYQKEQLDQIGQALHAEACSGEDHPGANGRKADKQQPRRQGLADCLVLPHAHPFIRHGDDVIPRAVV